MLTLLTLHTRHNNSVWKSLMTWCWGRARPSNGKLNKSRHIKRNHDIFSSSCLFINTHIKRLIKSQLVYSQLLSCSRVVITARNILSVLYCIIPFIYAGHYQTSAHLITTKDPGTEQWTGHYRPDLLISRLSPACLSLSLERAPNLYRKHSGKAPNSPISLLNFRWQDHFLTPNGNMGI